MPSLDENPIISFYRNGNFGSGYFATGYNIGKDYEYGGGLRIETAEWMYLTFRRTH